MCIIHDYADSTQKKYRDFELSQTSYYFLGSKGKQVLGFPGWCRGAMVSAFDQKERESWLWVRFTSRVKRISVLLRQLHVQTCQVVCPTTPP